MATATTLCLAYLAGGCSLVFSAPPPSGAERSRERPHVDCSTSIVPPLADSVLGTYQLVRSGYAAAANESAYRGSPIGREVDLALGLGAFAIFAGSAIYGYHAAARCSRVKNGQPSEGYEPGVSDELPPAAKTSLWQHRIPGRATAVAFGELHEFDGPSKAR